jgi:plastocyanin
MRRLLVVVPLLLSLVPATQVGAAATKTVSVRDDYFGSNRDRPPTVRVSLNDTVRWRFVGRGEHNVVVTRGPRRFRSDLFSRGDTYRKKLRARGTYRIVCTVHQPDMRMTLRVR